MIEKTYTIQVGEVFTQEKADELKEYLELKDKDTEDKFLKSIKECGDVFVQLVRLDDNEWKASSGSVVDRKIIGFHTECTAETPEGAVNLLLSNIKKQ